MILAEEGGFAATLGGSLVVAFDEERERFARVVAHPEQAMGMAKVLGALARLTAMSGSTPALTDPAVGPLCDFANDEWCIGSGTTGHCGPRGKVGEACGVPGDESTLACESTSCGPNGKCAAATVKQLCAGPH